MSEGTQNNFMIEGMKNHPIVAKLLIVGAGVLSAAGCGGGNALNALNSTTTTAGTGETFPTGTPTTTAETSTTTAAEAVVCPGTWIIEQADNTDHRWFADGMDAIDKADTDPKAQRAFEAWLHEVKKDPDLLAGAAVALIDKKVTAAELTDKQCASDLAEQIAAEIEIAVAMGEVKPSEAPASGRNTGIDSAGNVVTAEGSGISGDRKAILIITKNGKKVWIMRRCGNVVTEEGGTPNLPAGPTDEGVPSKYDNNTLPPGDRTSAEQGGGGPDVGGIGPAEQPVDDAGRNTHETAPPVPPEDTVPPQSNPQPTGTATTGRQPTASSTPPTTIHINPPNTGVTPTEPPVGS